MENEVNDALSFMSDSLELRVELRKKIEQLVYLENGETHESREFADELFADLNERVATFNIKK